MHMMDRWFNETWPGPWSLGQASFRHLEQSCTALERKVSTSRTMGSARRFVGLFWDGYDLNS